MKHSTEHEHDSEWAASPPPDQDPEPIISAGYAHACAQCAKSKGMALAYREITYSDLREPLRQWAYELPWRVYSKMPKGSCDGCFTVGVHLHAVLLLFIDKLLVHDMKNDQDLEWYI